MKAQNENEIVISIREELLKLSEDKFRKFTQNLIPGVDNILGIRTPILREISKKIADNPKWKNYVLYEEMEYFEEFMLQGMVIGLKRKENFDDILKLTEKFVPRINNWSVCDCFCTDLKIVKKHQEQTWEFLHRYFCSDEEYEVRFAVVLTLKHLIDEKYLDKIFLKIDNLKSHLYYVQMAIAWLVAEIYIKFPEETLMYINNNNLDDFTHNKAIQKICESFRVDKDTKEFLKTLKR